MLLIEADKLFKQAREYLEGRTLEGKPCEQSYEKADRILNEILNYNIGNPLILYVLGSSQLSQGRFGAAVQILSSVVATKPDFGEAWNNLALAWRSANEWDKATECTREAAKHLGHPDIWVNLSGVYCNRNMPEKALIECDNALAHVTDTSSVQYQKICFHKALALLESRRWGEAWDLHEARLLNGGNEEVAERNYHGDEKTPLWDGKSKGRVVIHGEQGMGDEIMFGSCIPDALKTGAEFIIEPSPRMETVFARSFPQAKVYGTDDVDGRRWIGELGKPDFKIGMGSLPKFFRRKDSDFPGTPYLKPDSDKRAWWGDKLNALGPGLRIGLAWQGGVTQTRYDARSFHPSLYAPLFQSFPDAHFISLQYDKTAQECVREVKEQFGIKIHHWPKAVEQRDPATKKLNDLDELVALISKLDVVVSVCQTAIHVSGALGIPTFCLTPSDPSWRYGAGTSPVMPWYGSVTLIRQDKGEDWTNAINKAVEELGKFLMQRKAMEC